VPLALVFWYTQYMENLDILLQRYEEANNSHDWEKVKEFIHPEASYFFTDGTFIGIEQIKKAVCDTFACIENEIYTVSEIVWVAQNQTTAVCRYLFHWKGEVKGKTKEGNGRGTNVWVKENEIWLITHEHLST